MTGTARVAVRASVRLAVGWFACAWLIAGCNSLLDIHEPSDQVLQEQQDAGTLARRDSGPREQDREPAPSGSDTGGSGAPSPVPDRDAGTVITHVTTDASVGTTDAGSGEDSIYLWANWPMPNPLATSLPNGQGYAIVAAGRVADQVTHLEWQQFSDEALKSWSDAVAYCEGLQLDGIGGWRLPARIELLSLLDFSVATPAIDAQTFSDKPADFFWSSTPFIGKRGSAWGVNFGFQDGFAFTGDMKELHRVRCVR